MIEVTVRKDEIKISGHANYAVSGSDIVCAGVTALALTLIKSIKDLTDDKIEYEISPGRVDIKYGNLSEKSKTLIPFSLASVRLPRSFRSMSGSCNLM